MSLVLLVLFGEQSQDQGQKQGKEAVLWNWPAFWVASSWTQKPWTSKTISFFWWMAFSAKAFIDKVSKEGIECCWAKRRKNKCTTLDSITLTVQASIYWPQWAFSNPEVIHNYSQCGSRSHTAGQVRQCYIHEGIPASAAQETLASNACYPKSSRLQLEHQILSVKVELTVF